MAGEGGQEPLDTAPLPDSRRRGGRNLPVAIASGVLLAGLFLGSLAWDEYAVLTFVAIIVVIGLLEVDGALRDEGLRPATPVALATGLLAFYGSYVLGAEAQSLSLALLVLGTLAWTLTDRHRERALASVGASFLMTLWVPFCASFFGLLLAREDGRWLVLAVILLTAASDIGQYAAGRTFGRHKLAPTVSPAKTWEGLAGGIVTVMVLAGTVVPLMVDDLGVPAALTLGDLSESLIKRDLGIKDLGRIVPGHGGIMDRVDAMIFALPTAHLILLALGL
jgi:phosphatidate cytidylyltransferase